MNKKTIISQLKEKYIHTNKNNIIYSKLNRNLQAEINKINSIKKVIDTKKIDLIELSRLEFSLEALLKLVRNLKCKKD